MVNNHSMFNIHVMSLRMRLLLLTIVLGALPVLASSFFITHRTEESLVWEKQQKLFGITRILDKHLAGAYEDLPGQSSLRGSTREERIKSLNAILAPYTDQVASAYSGIGVGYYSKDLDAIITYGPSNIYGNTVGRPIGGDHQGRQVMETGRELVQEGSLVRGNIMNAMHPIVRNGATIGYIWANELTEDIQAQVGEMKRNIYWASLTGLLLGLFGIGLVVDSLTKGINHIKTGVLQLQDDLDYRLPRVGGELGEISVVINHLADEIVAKKQLEEQVQRAERLAAVGEIAAGLAHEVRNPLMSIRGFAQLLQEENPNTPQKGYLSIIVSETERMNQLIEKLLFYAKPAVKRQETVYLNAVVENSLLLVETQLRQRQIKQIVRLGVEIPPITADAEQVKQVLLNILLNAMQAIGEKGVIRISTRYLPRERHVQVRVADTGGGVAQENLERIFDPFFTTKEQGTGLGLSVAYRLMETWGGSIRVESGPGQGSKFILIFPTK